MESRNRGGTVPQASPEKAAHGTARGVLTRGGAALFAVGLVLAAVNLRPAITSLGPLLEEVRDALGMNATVAGLLTSAPALCFAIFGATAPRLARRYGPVAILLAGMVAVTAGVALRPLSGGTTVFLLTSALALAGIAVTNVLLPVIVKRYFPERVGAMTGLYSMALALGTSGAAALTVPLTSALDDSWRAGLAVWAIPGLLALIPWLLVAYRNRAAPQRPAAAGSAAEEKEHPRPLTRSPTAWALALYFGFQSTAAYMIMGWLPQIFRDAGVPAGTAGLLLAVATGVSVPLSFILPRIAARLSHQGPLIAVLGGCGLIGYVGLWTAPATGALAWALLVGVSNCAFPVALTLIGMRARTAAGVARLSAFAQSTGYLLAVPGPLLVGALYGATGGWHASLALMTVLLVAQIGVGVLAGRNRLIEDEGRA